MTPDESCGRIWLESDVQSHRQDKTNLVDLLEQPKWPTFINLQMQNNITRFHKSYNPTGSVRGFGLLNSIGNSHALIPVWILKNSVSHVSATYKLDLVNDNENDFLVFSFNTSLWSILLVCIEHTLLVVPLWMTILKMVSCPAPGSRPGEYTPLAFWKNYVTLCTRPVLLSFLDYKSIAKVISRVLNVF